MEWREIENSSMYRREVEKVEVGEGAELRRGVEDVGRGVDSGSGHEGEWWQCCLKPPGA
jgi:hypothetical protein